MTKEANTVWFGRLTDKPICKGPLGAIRLFSLAQRPGVEEMVTVTNAVVFVQQDRFEVNAARCLDYCAVRRYAVAGLISGDWPAALQMLDDGLASVIIVSTPAHLEQAQLAATRGESRVEIVPKRLNRRRPATRPVARMATLT